MSIEPTTRGRAITLWQPWATLCVLERSCDCGAAPGGVHRGACPQHVRPWKTIETRSWKAPEWLIGQRIAIHAAARQPDRLVVGQFEAWPADRKSQPHPNHPNGRPARIYRNDVRFLRLALWETLPLGAVVGTAVLADCVEMSDGHRTFEDGDDIGPSHRGQLVVGDDGLWLYGTNSAEVVDVSDQAPFGHFEAGRWAWILKDPIKFEPPAECRGFQRVWKLPADLQYILARGALS